MRGVFCYFSTCLISVRHPFEVAKLELTWRWKYIPFLTVHFKAVYVIEQEKMQEGREIMEAEDNKCESKAGVRVKY